MPASAALAAFVIALVFAAPAAAQAPPPDERAAAQAFADAAGRLVAAAEVIDEDPDWLRDCRALRREPPLRREHRAEAFVDGLVLRDLIGRLQPDVTRFRREIAQAQTADPVLISGRAAARRIGRSIATFPPPAEDPCAAYRAYARAGYPAGPAREAAALDALLTRLVTPGMERRIEAAAERMAELGVPEGDAEAFRQLAD